MDHKAFWNGLSPSAREALTRRADAPALRRLAVQAAAMVGMAGCILWDAPLWPLMMVPLGVMIVFFFTLNHEAIHRTAFATRRLNDAVAGAVGFLILLPPDWFRCFHFAHHRHTQDPERDPELAGPKPETWPAFIWHVSGLPYWIAQSRLLLSNAAGLNDDAFVPEGARAKVQREARLMLAGYASLALLSALAQSAALVWIWVAPALLGQPFLRLYLLAEHGRCPMVANMFENTRTTFTNRLVRFIAWNMPYHAEHHAAPSVPFHRLPELHAKAAEHLRVTAPSYRRFVADYAGALRR